MNVHVKETHSPAINMFIAVQVIVDRSLEPLTLKQIIKELPGPKAQLEESLARAIAVMLAGGNVFDWGTPARPAYWNRDPIAHARAAILDATQSGPLSAAQLKVVASKAFPGISQHSFASLLLRMVADKLFFECAPVRKGGQPRYANAPVIAESLDELILSKIKRQRVSVPALRKEVTALLPHTSDAEIGVALHRLEKAGSIFRHPPIKKMLGLKWGRTRPNLAAQFSALATVDKKRTMLIEYGFSREAVDAAIRSKLTRSVIEFRVPEDLAERLLVIVRASRQPVVSLLALWSLVTCSKAEFDFAILRLRNSGRAFLVAHEKPETLNEAQRRELVSEVGDRFYTGITHFASRSSGFHPAL